MMEVSLREYVEALLNEHKRASDMAEREREKAALALREEQFRAAETAAQEREKAAAALAVGLARSIAEGDDRLREHIQAQYGQIAAALESARRETAFAHAASEKAIAKAEAATDKRFHGVNEFRAQLSDQAATFVPRELFETLLARVAAVELTLSNHAGRDVATATTSDKDERWHLWAAGSILTLGLTIMAIGVGFLR